MQDASSQLFERLFSPLNLPHIERITKRSLIGLSISADSSPTVFVAWYRALFTVTDGCLLARTVDAAYS